MWRRVFWQLISSILISRKWEYEPIRQFKLSVLLCILCKCNCRRSSSHCKSVTQFAPQKCVSLITEKFPNEEGGQWPASVTHFAKVTYLRPPTRLFHSPTLRGLGLCCDRSKPPRGRDVEQSSPRPDWIQNRQAHPGGRSQKLPPEAEQRQPSRWPYLRLPAVLSAEFQCYLWGMVAVLLMTLQSGLSTATTLHVMAVRI